MAPTTCDSDSIYCNPKLSPPTARPSNGPRLLARQLPRLCLRRPSKFKSPLLHMSVSTACTATHRCLYSRRMPFVEPTTSRTCAHSFCYDCIGPALQASPHCPIDRSPLSPQDMSPSNPIVRHVRTRVSSFPFPYSFSPR